MLLLVVLLVILGYAIIIDILTRVQKQRDTDETVNLSKRHQYKYEGVIIPTPNSQTLTDSVVKKEFPVDGALNNLDLSFYDMDDLDLLMTAWLDSVKNVNEYQVQKHTYKHWDSAGGEFWYGRIPLNPVLNFNGVIILTKKAPTESRKDD